MPRPIGALEPFTRQTFFIVGSDNGQASIALLLASQGLSEHLSFQAK
jgi:hypothetical protein